MDDPESCSNKALCYYAQENGNGWKGHTSEANRRGLICETQKIIANISKLQKLFVELSKDQRKVLQSNLKELGYYNSNIDGLYGRGTSGALTAYNKEQLGNPDLKVSNNVSALVEAVLALNDAEGISPETPIVEAHIVAEVVPEVEVAEAEPEVEIPENYQSGIDAYNGGDFKKAMEQAKLLAPLGNADAQFYLGKMYAEGKGTLQRNTHAHMWFNLASANGHSEAAAYSGVIRPPIPI